MRTNEIRRSFLDFFSKYGHEIMKSSPLIPHHDPSLMFTNSGMVQFKNWFTGLEQPKFPRVTTAQKCIRAGGKHNDLENVGYTARHHTFFEMLGNFSFGDYFKEQAIYYAWQLITKVFSIPAARLYITVYSEDDEAYDLWHKLTGFGSDRILRISTADNFWSMGDIGPCGPCSEIFFDHGPKYIGGLPGTPDQDGDRYVEIWNLVFMQYEQLPDKNRINLPKPSIDTGMGLERIAAVLQGVNDNFLTDSFQQIIMASTEISGNKDNLTSHKVIADHLRASSFLIADGVLPDNEGRGYVLRRIMRRAMRHVHQLGYNQALLYQLAPILINEMQEAYPELIQAEQTIISVLKLEEEKFSETLDRGIKVLKQSINEIGSDKILQGEIAFKLYDTYGFPLDLTKDILRSYDIGLDETGFETAMAEQKARARASWSGSGEHLEDKIWFNISEKYGPTEFLYDTALIEARVVAIIVQGEEVQKLEKGQEGIIILNHTPFYGESGGQIGDTGLFKVLNNNQEGEAGLIKVLDTKIFGNKIFAHYVQASQAVDLEVNTSVKAEIDIERRNRIKANHSATHLLHKALRHYLGAHVVQKGSLVTADKLRFDFVHNQSLSEDQIMTLELLTNQMIIGNNTTRVQLMPYGHALKEGAMALFGEKYGDNVRVVQMGDSIELCGGTHVKSTGDIGMLKIISEEAIASGIRRIEAVTGIAALEYCQTQINQLKNIAQLLKCSRLEVEERVSNLLNEKKTLEKEGQKAKIHAYLGQVQTKVIQSSKRTQALRSDQKTKLSYLIVQDLESGILKQIMESMKAVKSDIHLLINEKDHKLMLVISAEKGVGYPTAHDLLKLIISKFGGKGGGNAELAQGGSIDIKAEDLISFLCKELER